MKKLLPMMIFSCLFVFTACGTNPDDSRLLTPEEEKKYAGLLEFVAPDIEHPRHFEEKDGPKFDYPGNWNIEKVASANNKGLAFYLSTYAITTPQSTRGEIILLNKELNEDERDDAITQYGKTIKWVNTKDPKMYKSSVPVKGLTWGKGSKFYATVQSFRGMILKGEGDSMRRKPYMVRIAALPFPETGRSMLVIFFVDPVGEEQVEPGIDQIRRSLYY